jgi:hypothetical protein
MELLFQKLLIMDNCTQRMDNAICFTNNGTKPLIITNTQGSCGCTVPTSPKELLRGKSIIGVKYATDRVGRSLKQ